VPRTLPELHGRTARRAGLGLARPALRRRQHHNAASNRTLGVHVPAEAVHLSRNSVRRGGLPILLLAQARRAGLGSSPLELGAKRPLGNRDLSHVAFPALHHATPLPLLQRPSCLHTFDLSPLFRQRLLLAHVASTTVGDLPVMLPCRRLRNPTARAVVHVLRLNWPSRHSTGQNARSS